MSTRELLQETADNLELWLNEADSLPDDVVEGMEISLDKLERQLELL